MKISRFCIATYHGEIQNWAVLGSQKVWMTNVYEVEDHNREILTSEGVTYITK